MDGQYEQADGWPLNVYGCARPAASFLLTDGMVQTICVIVNDRPYNPPPRIRAIIDDLIANADKIARIPSGKLVYNLGPSTIKHVFEEAGDQIAVGTA